MIRASLCAICALMLSAPPAMGAFPGTPGPIAYSKTSTDEVGEGTLERLGGIFAYGLAGSRHSRPLTLDPDDHSPSYSADGRSIVFVSKGAGGRDSIFVTRSDGSERKEVTVDGLGGSDPAFFPSGRSIVFVRSVDGRRQIFTLRLDGSGLRQLTDGPYASYDPAISPSGRRIAFISDRNSDRNRDQRDLFVMRADGSHVHGLIGGPRSESEPDWAPDGRRIAFVVGMMRSNVFVIDMRDRRAKRLTNCRGIRCRSYVSPAFSPNGKQIAALGLGRRSSTISLIRVAGGGVGRTIDSGSTEEEGFGSHVGAPAWGPLPSG